jgi:dihydrofolate synthase/folylpolyglutamate synthase
MTYDEAEALLYSYTYRGLAPEKMHLPDEDRPVRARALLEAFGNPQNQVPAIHITGTKGKGSTAAMCAAILQAAGLRVGLLTSPHLQELRERIQINRKLISREEFAALVNRSKPVFEAMTTARFPECLVSLAFQYFAQQHTDINVIEVGLGGRLDATNVLQAPEVCIFTSISFDHMYLLGNTLAAIATEKAGIIKPGAAVVSAPQAPEVIDVLERICQERGCTLTVIGRELPFTPEPPSLNGQGVQIGGKSYHTVLLGAFQAINAVVAVGAIERLRARGFTIPDAALGEGLREVRWAGRLEIVKETPLVILDGAHNGESGARLREALREIFNRQPCVLIYASKANKDVVGTLREILPAADLLILTRSADQVTQDPSALIPLVRDAGYLGAVEVVAVLSEAIQQAERLAGDSGMVCITGSLYLVGEARTVYGLEPD